MHYNILRPIFRLQEIKVNIRVPQGGVSSESVTAAQCEIHTARLLAVTSYATLLFAVAFKQTSSQKCIASQTACCLAGTQAAAKGSSQTSISRRCCCGLSAYSCSTLGLTMTKLDAGVLAAHATITTAHLYLINVVITSSCRCNVYNMWWYKGSAES